MKLRSLAFGLILVPALISCGKKSSTAADNSTTAADTFTVANISRAWTTGCEAGHEPITGDDHFITQLTLDSGGTFTSIIYWYTGATCIPGNYHSVYDLYGTYTLGGFVSGSTTTKTLNFTIDFVNYGGTDLMTYGNPARTSYNSDCGGTSPFTGGANATNGGHVDTQHMTCMSETFPNASLRATFSNVATFSGGVLTIGAAGSANIPGTFVGGTLPTTATVPLN